MTMPDQPGRTLLNASNRGGCEEEPPKGYFCTRDFHHNGPCALLRERWSDDPATTQAPSVIARRSLSDIDPTGYLESDRDYVLNNLEAAVQLLDRALAASVPSTAAPWPMEVQPDGNVIAVDPSELKPNTAASVTAWRGRAAS